ncbi:MAG: copper homeostasis protein CutC [Propionibacteriaceae bacterium]|nr:copper homeostasis protein CutC [Propionibacteriaceae bacterium]
MSDSGATPGTRSALLEVIVLDAEDAVRAAAGGADRVELVGTMRESGLSPSPEVVAQVCRAVEIPVRPMVRLRGGFGTDAAEVSRLVGLARAFMDAGADGLVLGFLDDTGALDLEPVAALVGSGDVPWTFHRAIDHAADPDAAWSLLPGLPGLDQVLTAGSADGVGAGLDALLSRARSDADAAALIMAGGGLRVEHVPDLLDAGVRAFHIGSPARQGGSFEQAVDPDRVAAWRERLLVQQPVVLET